MRGVYPRLGSLTAAVCVAGCTGSPTTGAPVAGPLTRSYFAAATEQICQGYAEAQKALATDLMYAQCMYARGYSVPGFSPSPDSPGYQGGLPGPGATGGGH